MHHHHEGLGCGRRAAGAGDRTRPFRLPGARPRFLPDRPARVTHYRLDVSLDLPERRLDGTATLSLHFQRGADRVRLDAAELDVADVRWADAPGQALAFDVADEALVVRLDAPVVAGARRDLVVRYATRPRRGLHFVLPDREHRQRQAMAWTQGQDEHARAWFPCLDTPRDRATTEVIAEVPEPMEALSNGVLVAQEPGSRPRTRRFHWRLDQPHPPYLVTLVAGTFAALDDRWETPDGRVVPLRLLVPPRLAPLAGRTFAPTRAMMDHLSAWTGVPFPWPRYDQVVVEEFTFGGMENTTQTTLTARTLHDASVAEDFTSDHLVVHELAHQWFGDLVTCRDWSHAWLNEGFATFCEALWEERARGRDAYDTAVLDMREQYLEEADARYARPLVTRAFHAPIDLFDRHLYEKGALVLHHLRGLLGDDDLRAGVRRYLEAHRAGGAVETVDLERALFDETGRDLGAFFRQWVHRKGHPALKVSFEHDAAAGLGRVTVEQTQAGAPFELELDLVVVRGAARETHRLRLGGRKDVASLPMAAPPDRLVVDPDGWPCVTLELDLPAAWLRATLLEEARLIPRARAAAALAKKGGREDVDALRRALAQEGPYGLRGRVARALGEVGTTEARRALEAGLETVADPRVRARIADALGGFPGDPAAGDALAAILAGDRSPLVEAAAARALGRVRTPGAREALATTLAARESWNDVVRRGCLEGLGALFDPDALDACLPWLAYGKGEWTRYAAALAVGALADAGGMTTRTRVVEALTSLLRDPELHARIGAIEGLQAAGDPRALRALDRVGDTDVDGRVRRLAREAMRAIREGQDRATREGRLRRDLDALRETSRKLRDRLERLEAIVDARLPGPGPHDGLPGRRERGGGGGGREERDVFRGTEGLQEG
ncbi:MAG: HEAT repeat domain-containing protein [Planctomycetes bacterium]|nr:HEAT repeat domain-containing protein [Planctomycetota bacterium]